MKLGGSLTRQDERDLTVSDSNPHVANIGHMVEVRAPKLELVFIYFRLSYLSHNIININIEQTNKQIRRIIVSYLFVCLSSSCVCPPAQDMENKMRNTLNEIYFGKTKDIVNDLR
jgi:hypothetical protein